MSADVDLDTVGSCILFYCCDGLLVIYVPITVSGLYMNSTLRPTSRLTDGVNVHAHGDLSGDPRVVTPRELSPEEAASSRHVFESTFSKPATRRLCSTGIRSSAI